ncbi:hypothetical protein HMPREF3182_01532 [Megasphaera hutchinsoni]|uniref:Uncharacterized protein n=1 Tax=Megasphaera hutchinsoni TaxID=1588748 RepID=A0A134CDE3_9FIRM|nr:hypothetical protein HMPREF3182_01532 [Megasphaera hutchinsoni]
MGMADIHPAHFTFATNFAIVCHWSHLPAPLTVQHTKFIINKVLKQDLFFNLFYGNVIQ